MESVKLFQITDYNSLQAALDKLCQFLEEWKVEQEKIFDCKLVACELVGNVLKYAKGDAGLRIKISEGFAQLKALSKSFFELPEKIVCSDWYAESGRGLFLVKSLCDGEIAAEIDGIVAKIKL